ncbi:hypothetical protein NPIL_324581 [Nephila pilipes]|uniref:Uncharacterized protein n=1 Tax=Nephila pilipes TaxID=299642 RepID=A0A8X6T188_NEPPI|nr:hypothetical protein NPIL_324581 [Nephila pilipes]
MNGIEASAFLFVFEFHQRKKALRHHCSSSVQYSPKEVTEDGVAPRETKKTRCSGTNRELERCTAPNTKSYSYLIDIKSDNSKSDSYLIDMKSDNSKSDSYLIDMKSDNSKSDSYLIDMKSDNIKSDRDRLRKLNNNPS